MHRKKIVVGQICPHKPTRSGSLLNCPYCEELTKERARLEPGAAIKNAVTRYLSAVRRTRTGIPVENHRVGKTPSPQKKISCRNLRRSRFDRTRPGTGTV
jgi:hypothetical protein